MSNSLNARPFILIVDDDVISQRLFRAIYNNSDYEIAFCGSAAECAQTLKSRQADLLITEVILPDDSGFELRKRIRLQFPELPVIFVSAVIDSGSRKILENISNDPFTFFLRKPVYKNAVLELTRQVITAARERHMHQNYFDQLQSDLTLASKMQKLMLPDWVSFSEEDFFLVANYVPHSHLSGDYFDLIRMKDDRYFFVVGDISGHGIRAALHMSVIQSLTNFFIRNAKPGNIICEYLNELNRQICVDFDSVFYLTCLAAIIDVKAGTIEYLSAGHPGFFVLEKGAGHLRYLGNQGDRNIPVGWLQDYHYDPACLVRSDFRDDSIFFALTDGVIERCREDGQMLGVEGIAEFRNESGDGGILPFSLAEQMKNAGYTNVQDDMLMLALGFLPKADDVIYRFVKSIPQSMAHATSIAQQAAEAVVEVLQDRQLSYKIELAIGEFFNNIIVHGFDNAMKIAPQILFKELIYKDRVELVFIDQAKEWNYVPKKSRFVDDIEDDFYVLAQAGRGMRIIEEIVSRIDRKRVDSLNITTFTLLLAEETQA